MVVSEEQLSRVYTINLSKVWLTPRIRRTKRAINMIREFAQRHMKSEEIKIDQSLNQVMWKRGIRHPPRKIRVKMVKDEDDVVTVSLYSEEVKEEEKVEEKPKVEAVPTVAAPTAEVEPAEITEVTEMEQMKVEEEERVEEEKPKRRAKAKEEEAEAEKVELSKEEIAEKEPEKIELSEEELAEVLAEQAEGLEIKEDEPKKRKGKKSEEESQD
jgi:large subunit ribosomal protein L31e